MNAPNPYAFPWTEDDGSQNTGMTLRDYFAAKVMQGLISADLDRAITPEMTAKLAYAQADALLTERNKT
jgi:hypothetical protein